MVASLGDLQMRRLLCCLLFAMTIQRCEAATVFQSIGDLSQAPYTPNGWCSACPGINSQVFDTFSLSNTTTIRSISFDITTNSYTLLPNIPLSAVQISIWTINQNLNPNIPPLMQYPYHDTPSTQIFSQTFTPAQFASVVNVTGLSASIDQAPFGDSIITVNTNALQLAAGFYDISFYDSQHLEIPNFAGLGNLYLQGYPLNGGFPGSTAGFALFDTVAAVPEPSTWVMLLTGLSGICFLSCRRSRKGASLHSLTYSNLI